MKAESAAERVIRRIAEDFEAEPEFLWEKTPDCAAFRHRGNRKWFAALMLGLPGGRLGLDAERADILNVKLDPRLIASLIDGRHYLPAYHMNKEHWISLVLDGSAPLEEFVTLVGMSYELTKGRKPTAGAGKIQFTV